MAIDEAPSAEPPARARRMLQWIVPFGALLLIWTSAGNHPLHAPDEGRYGTVSRDMVDAPSWLVPMFRDAPHLTKPPLIYWLQAASMRWLGENEFALRLPSLVAASLSVIVLGWFVRRVRGPDMATLAVGLYGLMPLPLIFGRLATTDAVLNLCWISALACAFLAVEARRSVAPRRAAASIAWLALAWAWVAVAALDKGPVAPAPIVIVGTWLALARRWSELRWFALHGLWGAAIALAPIGAWAWAIVERHPEAWRVWREQFVDRALLGAPTQALVPGMEAVADRADAEPFWFYLPIVLAGFFPATCALVLPWFNLRWREALRAFTLGDLRALLLVAVIGPLLFFSIARGKMPAYVMPIGAPLAVLVAGTLARWCGFGLARRRPDEPLAIDRPPDVRWTFLIASSLGVIGGFVAAIVLGGAEGAWTVAPLALLPLGAAVAAWCWSLGTVARRTALVVAWLSVGAALARMERVEDEMLMDRDMGARDMVARARHATGAVRPQFVVYAFRNPTIDFYAGEAPLLVWSVGDLRDAWPRLRADHAILVPRVTFEWMLREYPRLAEVLVPLGASESDGDADRASDWIWNRWPGKPTVILRMTGQAAMDDPNPPVPRTPEPHE